MGTPTARIQAFGVDVDGALEAIATGSIAGDVPAIGRLGREFRESLRTYQGRKRGGEYHQRDLRDDHAGSPRRVLRPSAGCGSVGHQADDPVELRIIWEGGKLEWHIVSALLGDLSAIDRPVHRGLNSIPGQTPITVTVWRGGETLDDDSSGEALWTDERFDQTFVAAGGPADLIRRLRLWATEREIALRYGSGKTAGPLHFDIPATDPRIQLISVGATGGIEWVFRGNLDRARGFSGAGVRREFFRRIGDLFGTDRSEG